LGEIDVEPAVRRCVGRGVEFALDPFSLEIHEHHVRGFQRLVGNPAWLDRKDGARAVECAGVAKREVYQAIALELEIGLEGLLFQFF